MGEGGGGILDPPLEEQKSVTSFGSVSCACTPTLAIVVITATTTAADLIAPRRGLCPWGFILMRLYTREDERKGREWGGGG